MVYSILPNCRIKHLILNCLQYNKALVSMAYPALFLLLFLLEPPAVTVQASRWCRSIPPAKKVPSHGRRNGMRLLNPTHSHLLIVWIFLTVYSFFRYQDLLFQSMVWNLTDKTVQDPEQLGHSWSCAGSTGLAEIYPSHIILCLQPSCMDMLQIFHIYFKFFKSSMNVPLILFFFF